VDNFVSTIERSYNSNTHPAHINNPSLSVIAIKDDNTIKTMSPHIFQEILHEHHILIPNYNLANIACDRYGLSSLNSLKEVCIMEGISIFIYLFFNLFNAFGYQDQSTTSNTPKIMDRQLKQFVENIETNHPNILRIIRMHSYAGIELSHFSSDHVAWRDTLLDFYCNQDDSTKQSLLRWTDVATKGSIQFWHIPPAGFGVFFDIRSGQQWIIIATPNYMDEDGIQKKIHSHVGIIILNST